MAIAITPDIEPIIGAYLREHLDVAALVGARVVSRTPASTGAAWVRYTQIASPAAGNSTTDRLVSALLQFDCYASVENTRAEASAIARTVRAALVAMSGTFGNDELGRAFVSGVPPRLVSSTRLPDDMLDPARERYVVTATVFTHAQ
jgi:Protein of unknown function (DUF3168)